MHKKKDGNHNHNNFESFFEEEEMKEKIQNNKVDFDNSLIFNLSKNNFYDINNENNGNEKILNFLENELTLNNKDEFNYSLSSNFFEIFDIKNKNSENIKEQNEEKEKVNVNTNDLMELNEVNNDINNIKNKLFEFNDGFTKQQIELNSIIKSLIKERDRKKSSFRKKSNGRRRSSFLKSISEESTEFERKSLKTDNKIDNNLIDNNLLNTLNENNIQALNIIPSFPYVPDFLKIFDLKKPKYYEEELLERKYSEYKIKIYFPRQFEALRAVYCATNEEFIKSIRKSIEWSVSGGKSKANFYKTIDGKYVIKNVSEMEFNMFIGSALNYFKHISKFLFHKMPSAIGKILGAYNIKIKIPGEKEKTFYIIYMENIYYGMITHINNYTFNSPDSNIMVYDLKGSRINRYVQQNQKKPGRVLLDTNFLEDFNGEPLFFDFNVFQILLNALNNDSRFLKDEGVIDYSLLIIFETDNNNKNEKKEENKIFKIIRLGIIDYLRKYTWDKQLESYGKKFIHGFTNPTIINPDSYSKRFMKKVKRYFVGI